MTFHLDESGANPSMLFRGDMYCPRCMGDRMELNIERGELSWVCAEDNCGQVTTMEYDVQARDWAWPEGQRPNIGCPWCRTCNIHPVAPWDGQDLWACGRATCHKVWRGFWTRYLSTDAPPRDRWTIRIPTRLVPFTWVAGNGEPIAAWASADAPTHNPIAELSRLAQGFIDHIAQVCGKAANQSDYTLCPDPEENPAAAERHWTDELETRPDIPHQHAGEIMHLQFPYGDIAVAVTLPVGLNQMATVFTLEPTSPQHDEALRALGQGVRGVVRALMVSAIKELDAAETPAVNTRN
jgi:hypothetical protein